jgi:hypothetical protein
MTPGFFDQAEYELYAALARAALCDAAPTTERIEHETALAAHHHQLEQWAGLCPANFADRTALVGAGLRACNSGNGCRTSLRAGHPSSARACFVSTKDWPAGGEVPRGAGF